MHASFPPGHACKGNLSSIFQLLPGDRSTGRGTSYLYCVNDEECDAYSFDESITDTGIFLCKWTMKLNTVGIKRESRDGICRKHCKRVGVLINMI